MKKIALLLTVFVLSIMQVHAAHLRDYLLFSAKLEGVQEVPVVTTNAKGIASLVLNKTRDTIFVNISVNGLSGVIASSHIHTGVAGTNGGVLIDLSPFIKGNKITTVLTGAVVTANLAKMLNEGLYINVHTATNPSGEIRGQIKLETDWNFSADMNGAKENPVASGNATGLGSFNLSLDKGTLRFNIICQNVSGTITGAHLHFGAAGKNGGVTENLTTFVSGNVISGTITPSVATLDSLFVGKIYVNVHTAANPNGELRAQLTTTKTLNFDAALNGAQEVPAVNTTTRGVAVIRLNPTMDTLSYDILGTGFSGAITGAHFHYGAAGVNGAVVHNITAGISGNRIKGIITGAALSGTAINDFLTGDIYVNLHTAANPNGEIRGQVFRLAREGYTINMSGAQEVPKVTSNAYGSGMVSVSREQDNAHYMWVVGGLSSVATGSHFHNAAMGQNGGVVHNMSSVMTAAGSDASAFGYWKSSDMPAFVTANSLQFRRDSIYLNVHNATNANGEIRGQALRGAINYAAPTLAPPPAEVKIARARENLLFSVKLEGAQEVPAVVTNAKGLGSFMLNRTRDTLAINIATNTLSGAIASAHIHTGATGTNGGVLIDLSPFIKGNKITTQLTGAAVTANLAAMLSEGLYVNVHTAANPGGEIRGQIKLETDWNFFADLNGAKQNPVVASNAYGLGSFNLTLDRSLMRFKVVCRDLTGSITSAHLHAGAAGKNGGVMQDLTTFISGNVISGIFTPTAATLDSLFAGKIYVNVHTAANPGGEIRSQLMNMKVLSFDANLTGAQERPIVSTAAQGLSVIRLNNKMDTLSYDVVATGLSGAITGAHFHDGALGVSGGVAHNISANISGNRIKGVITGAALTTMAVNNFLRGDMYLNLHTTANPNGEIRGQVYRLAREGYSINLTGMQEVPKVTTNAYGSGIVSVSREQDNAHYMWVVGGLGSVATGSHFHTGAAGQNGGVIYNMSALMTAAGTDVSAFGYWKNTDATPFTLTSAAKMGQDSVYLNIHNATNPNGEIRGQVLRGTINYVTTATHDVLFAKNNALNVAPNPAQGYIRIEIEKQESSRLFINIADMTGRIVYRQSENSNQKIYIATIDMSNYANGLYFISISDGQSIITKKIIKN